MKELSREKLLSSVAVFAACGGVLTVCPYTFGISRYLLYAIVAYGLVVLLKAVCFDRDLYANKLLPLLILFTISYGITILLNAKENFVVNSGQLVYTCFYFFLFFGQLSVLPRESRRRVLCAACWVILSGALLIAIGSLAVLVTRYVAYVPARGGSIMVGVTFRRGSLQLIGIGTGTSMLGDTCVMGLISLLMLWHEHRERFKAFFVIAGVILILTACAANAFTVLLLLSALAAGWTLCFALRGVSSRHGIERSKVVLKAVAMCVLAVALTAAAYFGIQKAEGIAVSKLYELEDRWAAWKEAKQMAEQTGEQAGEQTGEQAGEQSDDKWGGWLAGWPGGQAEELESHYDLEFTRSVSSSATGIRSLIWLEGIKLFFRHPLGVTDSNIRVDFSVVRADGEILELSYANLHNGYVTLLAASGIIGFGLIVVFGLRLLIQAIRAVMSGAEEGKYLSFLIGACAAVLAGDLVNGCFVLWRGLGYILLWLFLGEIYAITDAAVPFSEGRLAWWIQKSFLKDF